MAWKQSTAIIRTPHVSVTLTTIMLAYSGSAIVVLLVALFVLRNKTDKLRLAVLLVAIMLFGGILVQSLRPPVVGNLGIIALVIIGWILAAAAAKPKTKNDAFCVLSWGDNRRWSCHTVALP